MENNNKIPDTFCTLNNEVIPDEEFLKGIDEYKPKICPDIVKEICKEKGMVSSDPRVYKIISIIAQEKLEDILKDTAEIINVNKKTNKFLEFKELVEVLNTKGIKTNKTQYYCDNLNINIDKQK